MVSSPAAGTFVHLGHVGFNCKGEIEVSDDMEPGWTMMMEELQGYSVTKPLASGEMDIIVPGSLAGEKAAPLIAEVTPEVTDQHPSEPRVPC